MKSFTGNIQSYPVILFPWGIKDACSGNLLRYQIPIQVIEV